MNVFTIKDLENLSGIKAHTIRIWEQRYAFLKPQRTGTNIRYYSNAELKKVLNVALLNRFGYKISNINKMSDDEISKHILNLTHQHARKERIINQLLTYMIELEVDTFEETLNNHIGANGIESTINEVIFPFLEKIGILWVTNHINPAQEHLVTNIIRQKLVVGIENISVRPSNKQIVLLFLPEGQYHELGLLYVHYLLKSGAIKTLYLGANVPLSDIAFVVQHKKPGYLYAHLTGVTNTSAFEKFLRNLHLHIPDTPVIISGYIAEVYKKPIPANVQFKKSLDEVMQFLIHIS